MFIANVASSSFSIAVAIPDDGVVSDLHSVNGFILMFD